MQQRTEGSRVGFIDAGEIQGRHFHVNNLRENHVVEYQGVENRVVDVQPREYHFAGHQETGGQLWAQADDATTGDQTPELNGGSDELPVDNGGITGDQDDPSFIDNAPVAAPVATPEQNVAPIPSSPKVKAVVPVQETKSQDGPAGQPQGVPPTPQADQVPLPTQDLKDQGHTQDAVPPPVVPVLDAQGSGGTSPGVNQDTNQGGLTVEPIGGATASKQDEGENRNVVFGVLGGVGLVIALFAALIIYRRKKSWDEISDAMRLDGGDAPLGGSQPPSQFSTQDMANISNTQASRPLSDLSD